MPPLAFFFLSASAFLSALAASFFASAASPSFFPSAGAAFGSSTLKRYLHFGHSTLAPMSLGSLMRTGASQLGHGTLKLAMRHSRR